MIKHASPHALGVFARLSVGVFAVLATASLHAQLEGKKSDWVRYESSNHYQYEKQNSKNENLGTERFTPNQSIPGGQGASLTLSGGVHTFKLSPVVDRIEYRGRDYVSGTVQLEGWVEVADGTNGCFFAQVFHVALLKTENGELEYHTAGDVKEKLKGADAKYRVYKTGKKIAGKYVKINIIHDVTNPKEPEIRVYLDGSRVVTAPSFQAPGRKDYYIKYGAYNNSESDRETIKWKDVKIFKKK
jgi:hypothetical protein